MTNQHHDPVKLIYSSTARFPSEKAHPYQISQMCEAFAQNGTSVTLIVPGRRNTPELQNVSIFERYSIDPVFTVNVLSTLDLLPLTTFFPGRLSLFLQSVAVFIINLAYHLQLITKLTRNRNAIIYSRDAITLLLLSLAFPRRTRHFFYEAHTYPATGLGINIRRWLAPRLGGVIVITDHLRQRYETLGFEPDRILVAHDAIRAARFQIEGTRMSWREKHVWPADCFIVGYAGRFQLMQMDKGLGDLIDAVIALGRDKSSRPVRLALLGGPGEFIDQYRMRIVSAGLAVDTLIYAGQVPAADVPGYLKAFDVCAIPTPWTEFFAYYVSPLKLFEYMASGNAIVATDLPSTREIIRDGENGLLVPSSDPEALASALRRLRDAPSFADRLAAAAHAQVFAQYTWHARAARILDFIKRNISADQEIG